MAACVSIQHSPNRSTDSSPSSRRAVCDAVLEAVHRDLAEHGGDLALEALGEQREPRVGIGRVGEQAAEGDRLAEHRRGLGERERRRLVEDPWPRAR